VRGAAVRKEDATQYLALSRQRNDRVRLRGLVLAVASFFGLLTALSLYVLAPVWLGILAGVAILALSHLGAPADKPLVGRAVLIPKARKLTSDLVLNALENLGIAGINKAVAKGRPALVFTAPITRDGPGWRAEGDPLAGVTAGGGGEARPARLGATPPARVRVARGRRRGAPGPAGPVDRRRGHGQDPPEALAAAEIRHGRPVPGAAARHGPARPRGARCAVNLTLMFASMIIGAIPCMGKTFALRLILLIAALDKRSELHCFDLKGTGDLSPLAPIAHAYRAGEEDEDIEYAVADMRELKTELRRRAKVIRELPKDLCPENKVTPELASNRKLGLHPIVIGVDECQVWFEHPEHGAELEAICTDLVKRGPALGIVLILATQRPDAKSLPTGISANAVLRLCLKVMGQVENDMVLGTSAYKSGTRATMFSRMDRGIFYLAGEGDEPQITRGHYVHGPAVERIVDRARKGARPRTC
jgi:S-DNA-T family DNA segregation ATPase FtsK/SpoIIIE